MSLANFTNPSLEKLKVLLGSFSDAEIGRLEKQSIPYVEDQWFKVTEEVDGVEEGSREYKAVQVRADGSLVESGIEFDSDATYTGDIDEPVYFDNLQLNSTLFSGSVEVGKAYKVEAVEQESASEDNIYYIIPEGGGGSTDFRLQMSESVGLEKNVPAPNGADVVTDLGVVIESGVTVIQRVFDTARIYDEILYGYIDEEGYYCIDKSILGV